MTPLCHANRGHAVTNLPPTITTRIRSPLPTYDRQVARHRSKVTKTQWGKVLAGVSLIAGIFAVISEIPFLSTRSTIAPVLMALGVGVAAAAASMLLRD